MFKPTDDKLKIKQEQAKEPWNLLPAETDTYVRKT